MFLAVFLLIAIIIIIVIIINKESDSGYTFESPKKRAGKYGEAVATNVIKKVLKEDDLLFTNVNISYDGRYTELDNIVVNKYGVFIIEVKNYKGRLVGNEDEFEWKKYHTTPAGNTYVKTVKNPIKQVKRQIYLLAKYLYYYGSDVWVNGFVFMINQNSPVNNEYILMDPYSIDKAIHTPGRKQLTPKTIDEISKILTKYYREQVYP